MSVVIPLLYSGMLSLPFLPIISITQILDISLHLQSTAFTNPEKYFQGIIHISEKYIMIFHLLIMNSIYSLEDRDQRISHFVSHNKQSSPKC